jgi:hypothetical protein
MVGQYFKRRRDLAEMVTSTGSGLGSALFANVLHSALK